MLPEYVYTIARLATRGRDLAESIWGYAEPVDTPKIEECENIFREILKIIEETKELA